MLCVCEEVGKEYHAVEKRYYVFCRLVRDIMCFVKVSNLVVYLCRLVKHVMHHQKVPLCMSQR